MYTITLQDKPTPLSASLSMMLGTIKRMRGAELRTKFYIYLYIYIAARMKKKNICL